MPDSEPSASSPATPPTAPERPALPAAWQPFTFRGVAAFSQAKLGRLFVVQLLVALVVAGVVAGFLWLRGFPEIRLAIRQLPDSGAIHAGVLTTPRDTTAPLVETRHLCITVDSLDTGVASSLADFRVEFHRNHWAVCWPAGSIQWPYPAAKTIQFNRPELESWWGAWQPMLFALASIGVVVTLFASWVVLATLGFPIAWLVAYFKDRRITAAGAWKLAGAALLPGALLVCLGLVLYGLGIVDLLGLVSLWIAHIPAGWIYLTGAPFRLPRVRTKTQADPFGTAKPRLQNPFTGSKP